MAQLTPAQRLEIIAELKARGQDTSRFEVNPAPSAPAFKENAADTAGLKDLQTSYDAAQGLASSAKQFVNLQGQGDQGIATGLGYRIPIVGDAVRGIAALAHPDQATRLQQMDAINAKSWPQLRPQGSGPIRFYEAAGWKNAFPSAGNTGDANAGLAQSFSADAAEKLKRLQFISDYVAQGKGHYGQAEAAYTQQAAGGGAPPGQAAPPARTPPPAAPTPRPQAPAAPPDAFHPQGWTQALPARQQSALKLYAGSKGPPGDKSNPYVPQNAGQFAKLPQGSWVLDDDGTVFQKR